MRAMAHGKYHNTEKGPFCRRKGLMDSISVDQFLKHPDRLLSDAQAGQINLITRDGEPVFMAIPMGAQFNSQAVRHELAITLFDSEQISIGVASRIAGLSISEMIDELGKRQIPVTSYTDEEFAEELKYVRGLVDR